MTRTQKEKKTSRDTFKPLAERMRPKTIPEIVGQKDVIGEGTPLMNSLNSGTLPSLLLWGPPGSGKTTLARLLAQVTGYHLIATSAVTAGVKEVRAMIE